MSAKKAYFPPPIPEAVQRWLRTGMVSVDVWVHRETKEERGFVLPRDEANFTKETREVRVLQRDVDEVRSLKKSDDITEKVLEEAFWVARRRLAFKGFRSFVEGIKETLAMDVLQSLAGANLHETKRMARDARKAEQILKEALNRAKERRRASGGNGTPQPESPSRPRPDV